MQTEADFAANEIPPKPPASFKKAKRRAEAVFHHRRGFGFFLSPFVTFPFSARAKTFSTKNFGKVRQTFKKERKNFPTSLFFCLFCEFFLQSRLRPPLKIVSCANFFEANHAGSKNSSARGRSTAPSFVVYG
jgi:hypothetical protein